MAMKKEQIKKQLKAIRDMAESQKKMAEEKEVQYDVFFAYGWLRGSIQDAINNIDSLIEEL